MALLLREREIEKLLPMSLAVEVVEDVFRQYGSGDAINIPRQRVRLPKGMLHYMAAGVPGFGAVGYKAYTNFGRRASFFIVIYSSETGELLAILESDHLSQMRTGATTGVATKHMSRPDARVAGIFGSGKQARNQLMGICAARSLDSIRVYSPNPDRRQAFSKEMERVLQVEVRPVNDPQDAVKGCSIVTTATTAREPVFKGEWLENGSHINAMGTNFAIKREIDEATVRRSSIIVVDSLEDAKLECGDLIVPVERGTINWGQVHELGDVVVGRVNGRRSDEEITLFESQGLAIEDVAVAAKVYEQAKAQGLGERLPF